MSDNNKEIGQRCKQARLDACMSIQQLIDATGMSRSLVRTIENGLGNITDLSLSHYSKATAKPIEYLKNGTGNQSADESELAERVTKLEESVERQESQLETMHSIIMQLNEDLAQLSPKKKSPSTQAG